MALAVAGLLAARSLPLPWARSPCRRRRRRRDPRQRPRRRLLRRPGLTGPSGLEELYPENWVNYGSWDLGGINYAVYSGDEAILYDTGTLPSLGQWERDYLTNELGIKRFTVVLSHWHLDHIAGLEAFADSPIYANAATNAYMRANKKAIEAGTLWGMPAVPVVMPTNVVGLGTTLELTVGTSRSSSATTTSTAATAGRWSSRPTGPSIPVTCSRTRSPTWSIRAGSPPTSRSLPGCGSSTSTASTRTTATMPSIMAGGYTKTFIDAMIEYDRACSTASRRRLPRDEHRAGHPERAGGWGVSIWESHRSSTR